MFARKVFLVVGLLVLMSLLVSFPLYAQYEGQASASSTSGTAGSTITITGSGFAPNSTVTIFFDGSIVRTVQADSNGNVSVQIRIPSDASVGDHVIKLVDSEGTTVTITFTVTTGFPFTGANLLLWGVGGLALVGLGIALVRRQPS